MDILVDRMREDDAGQMLEYLKTVGGESDNLLFGAEGLPIDEAREREIIRGANVPGVCAMFAARLGAEIIGCGMIRRLHRERIAHRCEIAVSVRKAHWGRGAGSKLMAAMIGFAKNEAGAEIVSLEVRSDNGRAIALYTKLGFEKFGTYRKFFKIRGEYFDADYMNLYL